MKLQLKKPCCDCPFKNDKDYQRGWLGEARARQIIFSLYLQDRSFTCHKTLDNEDREQQHCAGAMILMERSGRANQYMRIMERIGYYKRENLNMNTPVFDTPSQFINWHSGSEVVTEYQQRQKASQLPEAERAVLAEVSANEAEEWRLRKDAEFNALMRELSADMDLRYENGGYDDDDY